MFPADAESGAKGQTTFKRRLVRFSLTLIGALSVLAFMAGFALWSVLMPPLSARLEHDTEYLAQRLARELEVAAAAEDKSIAKATIDPLWDDSDLEGIAVWLTDGRTLYLAPPSFADSASVLRDAATRVAMWRDGRVAFAESIEVEGTQLGVVLVASSTRRIDILDHWFGAFATLILVFLAWSTWYTIRFDRRFVSPLRMISAFARNVGAGALHTRLDNHQSTAEVHDLVSQLNKMVDALETQRDELVRAREAAEQASEVKTRFLANMSHEMRTPLNGVIGISDLLLAAPLPQELMKDIRIISASASGLRDIINDVLDVAKIEAGKVTVERIDTDLSEVLRLCLYGVLHRARSSGIRLRASLAPNVPSTLVTDPVRLRQVLLNLLSNAVKFTKQGEVRLDVRRVEGELLISVEDDGIGMSDEQLANIFEAFKQADTSTTRRFGGTGLGLAIAESLTDLLGGRLAVESTLGRGSTFRLTLPIGDGGRAGELPCDPELRCAVLGPTPWASTIEDRLRFVGVRLSLPAAATMVFVCVDREQDLEAVLPTVESLRDGSRRILAVVQPDRLGNEDLLRSLHPDGVVSEPAFAVDLLTPHRLTDDVAVRGHTGDTRHGRILVAEDNVVNQRVVVRMLGRLGFESTLVEDGEQAVRAVRDDEVPYDLILMDLQMPNMDGFEAAAQIRGDGFELPIVALTADAMSSSLARCLNAGMNDLLSKPIKLDELQAMVERWLDSRSSSHEDDMGRMAMVRGARAPCGPTAETSPSC